MTTVLIYPNTGIAGPRDVRLSSSVFSSGISASASGSLSLSGSGTAATPVTASGSLAVTLVTTVLSMATGSLTLSAVGAYTRFHLRPIRLTVELHQPVIGLLVEERLY
jgi:hypothetical protein